MDLISQSSEECYNDISSYNEYVYGAVMTLIPGLAFNYFRIQYFVGDQELPVEMQTQLHGFQDDFEINQAEKAQIPIPIQDEIISADLSQPYHSATYTFLFSLTWFLIIMSNLYYFQKEKLKLKIYKNGVKTLQIQESQKPRLRNFLGMFDSDPLIIYGSDNKSDLLRKGLDKLKNQKFDQSFAMRILSFPYIFSGNGQNLIASIKEIIYRILFGPYKFDKKQILKLRDGGQICLEYKWHNSKSPILLVFPGFGGDKTSLYIHNIIDEAYSKQFNVILVNWRGLGGIEVTTPKLYSGDSSSDFMEAIEYVHDKYPLNPLFGYGASLSGSILSNVMAIQGSRCPLRAAVIFVSPIIFDMSNIENSCFGLYNRTLGDKWHKLFTNNLQIMTPILEKLNIDLPKYLSQNSPSFTQFDKDIISRLAGYNTVAKYYENIQCLNSLNKIKVPTFFLRAVDDPIIDEINSTLFDQNRDIALGSTNHGGHGPFQEQLFTWYGWSNQPILDFISAYV